MRSSFLLVLIAILLFSGCATTQGVKDDELVKTKEIDKLLSKEQIVINNKEDIIKNALPKRAKLGECYATVLTPPKYKTIAKQIPTKQTLYKTTTEKVLVKEAYYKEIKMPDKYEYVREKSVKYKTITTPSGERKIEIPSYTVKKVKVEDGKINKVLIPAVYKRVPKKTPYEKVIYKSEYQKELIEGEKEELKRVLCKKDYNKELFFEIQKKLKIFRSGEFDEETKKAITAFQKKHNLSVGGLTYETLEVLQKVRW